MKIEIDDELFDKEELLNTPTRYKKFLKEWENKCDDFNFTTFNNVGYTGMIGIRDISFYSLCAHHLLPFKGVAHIAYIPNKRICGASKLIRALEKFSHKPQLQEKITVQVAEFLEEELSPKGVAVVLEAKHDCMCIRGVKNSTSVMFTSELRGNFLKDIATREEFMRFIGK